MCCWWLLSPCAQWRGCPCAGPCWAFEIWVLLKYGQTFYTHLLHQQSSHGCSQTCNRYEICGRLHSSSEELKRQAEFLSVILQVCARWRSVSAPKRLFLAPKRSRRFFTFLHQIIFFSHQLGFFPAPKQFFSAPNDFGNCIWFCNNFVSAPKWHQIFGS